MASNHFESSDTTTKDTTTVVKPKDVIDQFNIRVYCDTIHQHDTIIQTEKGRIKIIVDSLGVAHLRAENDSLRFKFQEVKITHTEKDTVYVQADCTEIKHQLKAFRTKAYILLGLILLGIGLYVGFKISK